MPREITLTWVTPAGGGRKSVFFFQDGFSVADQRASLNTWIDSIAAFLHNTTTVSVDSSGREFNSVTGTLTGAWTESTPHSATGALSTGSPVADSTQALAQWHTGVVVAGRFLRGRTFIPGLSSASTASGNLSPAAVTGITNAGNVLHSNPSNGLVLWHRPKNGAGGAIWPVSAASAWSELAVLRRRRT